MQVIKVDSHLTKTPTMMAIPKLNNVPVKTYSDLSVALPLKRNLAGLMQKTYAVAHKTTGFSTHSGIKTTTVSMLGERHSAHKVLLYKTETEIIMTI